MTDIVTEKVTLSVADGTAMAAYVARPRGGQKRPGLLVIQEAFGVNAHIRDVTERFARQGYVAISPEMFHRTAPGFECPYGALDKALAEMQAMTETGMEQDLKAAHDWLKNQPDVQAGKIGGIGYCMGGRAAFLANATLPLQAAVSYYGGGIAPGLLGRAGALHGPMLLYWGGLDKYILPEHHRAVADALTQAGKPFVNVEFAHADHGFFCDDRPVYHPDAAAQSWALTLAFFRSTLG